MNMPRRKIWVALGTLTLASFSAMGAATAAMDFIGTFTTSRSNTAGTTAVNIATFPTFNCFLSDVRVEETDDAGESARCQLVVSGSSWVLQATLGQSSDADVFCGASCFTNP